MSTTTTAPGLPPRSFGELAVEAGHLLRTRLSRRSTHPGVSRVAQLQCLLALVVVTVLSTGIAWAAWNATVDHRLRLVAAKPTEGRVLEVSLEDRTTQRRLEAGPLGRGGGSYVATSGQPGTVRGGAGPDTVGGGGGLVVDGPVLGAVSAGGSLAAGAVAGVVLLRRARRLGASGEDTGTQAENEHVEDEEGEDLEDLEDLEDVDGSAADQAVETSEALGTTGADTGEQAGGPTGAEVVEAILAVPDTALSDGRDGSPPVPSTRQPVWSRGQDEQADLPPRQRLYERRRVADKVVDLPAQLLWLGGSWSGRVVELSDERFTLRMTERPAAVGRRAPLGAGDHLRVVLPSASGDVAAGAQVVWLRATADGFVAGVRFVGLSGSTLQGVQGICAA